MKKVATYMLIAPLLVGVVGCMPMQSRQMNSGLTPMAGSPGMVGPAGAVNQTAGTPYMNAQMQQPVQAFQSQTMSEVTSLRERVRRLERALIRMDKRMQLLERNELARISSLGMEGEETDPVQGMFQPMSMNIEPAAGPQTGRVAGMAVGNPRTAQSAQVAMQSAGMRAPAPSGYQPVSLNTQGYQPGGVITSALQAAPKTAAKAPVKRQAFSAMPSLADDSGKKQDDAASVSIWTVNYEPRKVWPAKEQLTASREVIDALRSEKPVALFARGARPSSKEFRERVRALSKYLSKVADVENVPIASMPAKHLDGDTIEVLATR